MYPLKIIKDRHTDPNNSSLGKLTRFVVNGLTSP